MTDRTPLSKRTRFEVFKRDGFKCCYCGRKPPEAVLVVDHVIAVADGGSDEYDNLTTSCWDCNAGKGAVPLGAVQPAFDEMAVLEAIQEMTERRMFLQTHLSAAQALRQDHDAAMKSAREHWLDLMQPMGNYTGFEARSIDTFLRMGLVLEDMTTAMDIVAAEAAMDATLSSMWKYFCKLCWETIRASRGNN